MPRRTNRATIGEHLSGAKLWPAELADFIVRLRDKTIAEIDGESEDFFSILPVCAVLARRDGDLLSARKIMRLLVLAHKQLPNNAYRQSTTAQMIADADEMARVIQAKRELWHAANRFGVTPDMVHDLAGVGSTADEIAPINF